MDTAKFSSWKRAIFRKAKEIKDLSGGVVLYATQSNPQIDAEIAEKGRFRTKTRLHHIVINALDIDSSLLFYTEILDLQGERIEEFKNNHVPFHLFV